MAILVPNMFLMVMNLIATYQLCEPHARACMIERLRGIYGKSSLHPITKQRGHFIIILMSLLSEAYSKKLIPTHQRWRHFHNLTMNELHGLEYKPINPLSTSNNSRDRMT